MSAKSTFLKVCFIGVIKSSEAFRKFPKVLSLNSTLERFSSQHYNGFRTADSCSNHCLILRIFRRLPEIKNCYMNVFSHKNERLVVYPGKSTTEV